MGNQDYNTLKASYDFFNHLMVQFEQTVELHSATYNLLNEIGRFTCASRVQLLKYNNGYYVLDEEWGLDNPIHSKNYPLKSHACWLSLLENKRKLFIENMDVLDEKLRVCIPLLDGYCIDSMYLLPMFDDTKINALLVICNPDKDSIQSIDMIYELLSNWLSFRLIKNPGLYNKTGIKK